MTPWWRSMMTAFDVEATGINTRTDHVVQWCVVDLHPDGKVYSDAELINPGVPIPPGATEVHHITDEMVRRGGNDPKSSLWRLTQRLGDAVKARVPIVVMNGPFDFTMLHHQCRAHGLPTVDEYAGMPLAPVVDIYVLDKHVDTYRKGGRKLEDLCRHYGVRHDGAHDAVEDTKATGRVAFKLAQRYPRIGNMLPHQLHEAQVGWRREQSVSLQQYFRKQPGREREIVDPCWPYCSAH